MEKLLTTKDLADAIGASESSLRRWTNSGAIRTSRTVGGHRRIPLSEAVRFIRETKSPVVRPDLIGLDVAQKTETTSAESRVYQPLLDGNATRAAGEIMSLYLEGMSVAAIFDEAIQPSMVKIGLLWEHDSRGIMVEHRATDICLSSIAGLRQAIATVPASAPVAVGGAAPGDPYLLPSLMAATVLADVGYRDINFGPNLPMDVLAAAADEQLASLVWVSIGNRESKNQLQAGIEKLARQLACRGAYLVIGGRMAPSINLKDISNVHLLNTMAELAAFSRGLTRV